VDAVLVAPPAPARSGVKLVQSEQWEHARVQRALAPRTGVQVWTTPDACALLALGRGVCGRREVSVEVDPAPGDHPLWAQVAPANTASLRAFLAAGYRPVGAEVLFAP
jgi:hypothetical protein